MQYRKFGTTDLLVSEIGFGAWAIGGDAMIGNTAIGWGPANDKDSKEAIKAALDCGINFFDTADIYGLGHSEKLLGEMLRGQNAIIATKVGNVARNNEFTFDYSKEYIITACEKSLQRLKRDRIDYYQLHTAKASHLEEGSCIQAMQVLQQQGKIRYWGISLNTFAPEPEASFFLKNKIGNGFQCVLNSINQKALPIIKEASSQGYGIIARMPLQFGLLTGKFTKASQFALTDHRRNRLTPAIIETTEKALDPLWKLCDKYGIDKTELAFSYVLSYSEISTVIPGIRTKAHVRANTRSVTHLDQEDLKMIESLYKTQFASLNDLIEKQG